MRNITDKNMSTGNKGIITRFEISDWSENELKYHALNIRVEMRAMADVLAKAMNQDLNLPLCFVFLGIFTGLL